MLFQIIDDFDGSRIEINSNDGDIKVSQLDPKGITVCTVGLDLSQATLLNKALETIINAANAESASPFIL